MDVSIRRNPTGSTVLEITFDAYDAQRMQAEMREAVASAMESAIKNIALAQVTEAMAWLEDNSRRGETTPYAPRTRRAAPVGNSRTTGTSGRVTIPPEDLI